MSDIHFVLFLIILKVTDCLNMLKSLQKLIIEYNNIMWIKFKKWFLANILRKKYYILLAEMGFSIYICSPNNENMKTNMVLHVVIVDILSLIVGQM